MKKFSVIALVCALAVMLCVPFGAFAGAPAFTLSAADVTGKVGDEVTVEVKFAMDEGMYVMNGGFEINYPADKLDLVIPPKTGLADPVNKLCTLTGVMAEVGVDEAKGTILIQFADSSAEALANMTDKVLAKLNFVVLAEGDIAIDVAVTSLARTEDGVTAIDALEEAGEIKAATEVKVEKEVVTTTTTKATTTTTKATTTTAKATTTTAKATTTKAPTQAGEATPWALLATVSVAGAALVVLSTKKSK